MNDLERADRKFDEYLDDDVHETLESAIFDIVKSAFQAGWKAASERT